MWTVISFSLSAPSSVFLFLSSFPLSLHHQNASACMPLSLSSQFLQSPHSHSTCRQADPRVDILSLPNSSLSARVQPVYVSGRSRGPSPALLLLFMLMYC